MKILILLLVTLNACDFGIGEVHSEMCIERIDTVMGADFTDVSDPKLTIAFDTVWVDCTKGHYYGPKLNPFN